MTLVEGALLGVVQGLTEFLPVSSSAHLILARAVFGWDAGELNLAFDVACHLGTLVAVGAFFGRDIAALVRGIPSALSARPNADGRRLWLLAAQIEESLGNNEVVGAYSQRAFALAPLVLPRILIEPNLGLGNLP